MGQPTAYLRSAVMIVAIAMAECAFNIPNGLIWAGGFMAGYLDKHEAKVSTLLCVKF